MQYETDLPLEKIDAELRALGYEPSGAPAGCIYRKGIFEVEIIRDAAGLIISHPVTVNGEPHPLMARAARFMRLE